MSECLLLCFLSAHMQGCSGQYGGNRGSPWPVPLPLCNPGVRRKWHAASSDSFQYGCRTNFQRVLESKNKVSEAFWHILLSPWQWKPLFLRVRLAKVKMKDNSSFFFAHYSVMAPKMGIDQSVCWTMFWLRLTPISRHVSDYKLKLCVECKGKITNHPLWQWKSKIN